MGALHVQRGNEAEQRENFATLMSDASQSLGFSMIPSLAAQLLVPMVIIDNVFFTLLTLPTVCYFVVWPFYHAGVILSLAITRAPYPVAKTYGIDLIGAAAGCLFSILIMNAIDAPSGVLLLSLLAVRTGRCFATPKRAMKVQTGFIALLLALNIALPNHIIFPLWMKATEVIPSKHLALDLWNSISRITVSKERVNAPPYLWGPSKNVPTNLRSSYYALQIDGCAETPIYNFGSSENLDFLNYDVSTLAYSLPSLNDACIIGLGGGRDVLSAHNAGVKDITALDINNIQIDLLTKKEPFVSYSGLKKIANLKMINSEARSWLSATDKKFDIIQMSLIDTWAATGAGAFALSENGLYTLEAWKTFISRLHPHGVLTVSRWYLADAHSETERLLSLATASLLDSGAARPSDHIYLAKSDHLATLVLARDPLTKEQLDALDKRCEEKAFTLLVSPRLQMDIKTSETILPAILNASSTAQLFELDRNGEYDVSPPTDNRPFFFNQVRLSNPAKVWNLVLLNNESAIIGHARAIFHLYLIIALSILMVIGVLLFPLRSALRAADRTMAIAGSLWFLFIGLGFMFTEIALLQKMSTFLGHPSYGLGVVLFGLVLATGMGSLLSNRIPLRSTQACVAWIIATASLTFGEVFLGNQTLIQFAGADIGIKILLCLALIIPVGILFGFGFPTGMSLVERGEGKQLTAWLWGVNGAAGVLGSAIGVAISIAAGLDATLLSGAICYALLLIPAVMLSKSHKQS